MILDNDFYTGADLSLPQPLTHARIGYRNIVTAAGLTVSSEQAGFPGEALANPFTYDLWRPEAFPAQIDIGTATPETVDYIGLARHNLAGRLVRLEYFAGGEWVPLTSFVPESNRPAMVLFEPVTSDQFRVIIDEYAEVGLDLDFQEQVYLLAETSTETDSYLSVLFLGEALAMARPIYGGHTPIPLSRRDAIQPARSDTGQFLGRTVVRQGYTASYQWQNLPAPWVRGYLKPFIDHAVAGSFFIAWRPDGYASEAGYGWIDQNTSASNQGVRNLMSYGFTMEALADG